MLMTQFVRSVARYAPRFAAVHTRSFGHSLITSKQKALKSKRAVFITKSNSMQRDLFHTPIAEFRQVLLQDSEQEE
jgi:hypothetical protein